MATYGDLMRGSIYEPVIVPGDSRHSILNMLVEGRADSSEHSSLLPGHIVVFHAVEKNTSGHVFSQSPKYGRVTGSMPARIGR